MTGGRQAGNIQSAAEELNMGQPRRNTVRSRVEGLNLEPPIYTNPAALALVHLSRCLKTCCKRKGLRSTKLPLQVEW